MKNSLETRLGVFFAIAAIAAVILSLVLGSFDFKPGIRLYGLFNSAHDLKVGDRVKVAGVVIGKVTEIGLDTTNNKVRITMKVDADAGVKTDSTATILFTGMMGQNFVALGFGTATGVPATEGTQLTTAEQPDLNQLMARVDSVASGVEKLTGSFSGDKIDNLLGPFTDFLKQNRGPLTATIANIEAVSKQVADGKGTVGKLINDDTLYNTALNTVSNLESTGDDLKGVLADARKVVGDVSAGRGTVGKLIEDDALYRQATETMTNVLEIMQKVNHGQGTVGQLINDHQFLDNAKLSLQKLDKATEGLEDEGPLSVMGIMANGLF
jgi:phospholipid/cholesterol/gamma-HCH transport system substrate-binding protein